MTSPRVAIVRGLRTPFVKSGTLFAELTALELGQRLVRELVERSDLDPESIDQVIFGQVTPSLTQPAIAREVMLAAGLSRKSDAYTVARACATSLQTLVNAGASILQGDAEVIIAGGTESLSDVPLFAGRALARALATAAKTPSLAGKLRLLRKLRPRDLVPVAPAIAEPSTGQSMGQSAEKMAKENHISREEQDALSLASHHNAARGWEAGFFADQVMPLVMPPQYTQVVERDNLVRPETSAQALAKLLPVFDREYGSVTAGNSSPLTDGAAALLVMSEARARSGGYTPLGFLRAHAFAAVDPSEQLLQAPAHAAPRALDKAGMKLSDIDLFEMHEAFGAQLASNLQAFASASFAKEKLGRSAPLGEVDRSRLNVTGGSMALGHPFAATGARLVMQALLNLKALNLSTALVTACAQGGLGAALILERA